MIDLFSSLFFFSFQLQNTVAVLDLANISQRQYELLAAAQPDMIREYLVQHERARLNREGEQSIPMAPTKDGLGYWRRLRSILLLILPAYNVSGPLKIKVSGDGRRCGRKRSQVMITFSILNAGSLSVSPNHHYTLALWEGHEDYDAFKEQLGDLLQDLRDAQNTGISLGDVNIPIVLYLSGDWKFIAIVMGLKSASAQEGFCIWCTAHKNDLATKDVFTPRLLDEVLRAFSTGRCTIPDRTGPLSLISFPSIA